MYSVFLSKLSRDSHATPMGYWFFRKFVIRICVCQKNSRFMDEPAFFVLLGRGIYAGRMASEGQESAQVPQSVQALGSIL
jgi:hypothetical protein